MEKPVLKEDLGIMLPLPESRKKRHYGLFLCSCGTEFRAMIESVNNGHTKSCGCYGRQSRSERIKRISKTHGLSKTVIYGVWKGLKKRCYNVNSKKYKDYGGRGIIVCDEWLTNFMNFYNWSMDNGYSDGLIIDRKNNDGNYEPGNCRWTTLYVNAQNKRLIQTNNTSGYRGLIKSNDKWVSIITYNGIVYRLGIFDTKIQAAIVYNNFVIENNTNHPLNIIPTLNTEL